MPHCRKLLIESTFGEFPSVFLELKWLEAKPLLDDSPRKRFINEISVFGFIHWGKYLCGDVFGVASMQMILSNILRSSHLDFLFKFHSADSILKKVINRGVADT